MALEIILVNEKNKKLIDYANFANDTIVLFKIVNSVLKISNKEIPSHTDILN
ncbi:hypothetical protein AFAEC_1800 [Aliarcobacter faecis]|uniref:hypothetical protein n=1 Tax=Aliarcobacter faecis TaxID=1564138 RepID=UPI0004B4F165|nr:hypothetical protein [Aliarcobacter faecis]QKF73952.1 hypothetical protein AFAEC_1800 [Aliarcobacter faecis]